MSIKSLTGVLCTLLLAVSFNSHAVPTGPGYPAPGGTDFSGNGVSGADGTAVWNYSNFDTNAFDSLYFGLNQVDYGPAGGGLDGTADSFSLFGISGQTAEWRANTLWANSVTAIHQAATTRLLMTITGLDANPWITDLASIGLDDVGTFGDIGAVVDNSIGADFTLQWSIQANTGGGWQSINSVQQHVSHNGATRSSFATGFYHTDPIATPEPSILALLALGLAGFGFVKRRA